MKKLLFLLAAVGMIFTACTPGGGLDDDNNGNNTEQPGGGNQGGEDNPDNPGGGNQGGEEGGGEDIPADKTQAIKFQDENTKLLCTLHWDENEDGELSYEEAAAVTDLGTAFKGSSILAFTELKYFTSLEKIADNAFKGCVSLVKTTLPEQLTIICTSAFSGCTNLKKIAIPNAVTEIGDDAFRDCKSLTSITIPDSVTSIGWNAFNGCTSLPSVTIPDSVTEIGNDAFSGCTALPVIDGIRYADTYLVKVVDKTRTSYSIKPRTQFIGNDAFSGCRSLTSITIPDSVTSIGGSAFYGCTGELIINSKIIETDYDSDHYPSFKYYSSGNWLYASNFTKLIIGNNITKIGNWTFSDCTSLTSITIPDSVTSIGGSAFSDCTSMKSVTIPDSVTSIGVSAFYDCSSLTSIYCKPTTPPVGGNNMFSYSNGGIVHNIGCAIYVPRNSVSTYKSAEFWSEYASYIYGYDF